MLRNTSTQNWIEISRFPFEKMSFEMPYIIQYWIRKHYSDPVVRISNWHPSNGNKLNKWPKTNSCCPSQEPQIIVTQYEGLSMSHSQSQFVPNSINIQDIKFGAMNFIYIRALHFRFVTDVCFKFICCCVTHGINVCVCVFVFDSILPTKRQLS